MVYFYLVKSIEGYPQTMLYHTKNISQYDFESMRAAVVHSLGKHCSYGEIVEQLKHQYGFQEIPSITV